MMWTKLGQIYKTKNKNKFLKTHAANPLAMHLQDNIFRIWELEKFTCKQMLLPFITLVKFSPSGEDIAIGSENTIHICNTKNPKNFLYMLYQPNVTANSDFVFSPNEKYTVCSDINIFQIFTFDPGVGMSMPIINRQFTHPIGKVFCSFSPVLFSMAVQISRIRSDRAESSSSVTAFSWIMAVTNRLSWGTVPNKSMPRFRQNNSMSRQASSFRSALLITTAAGIPK